MNWTYLRWLCGVCLVGCAVGGAKAQTQPMVPGNWQQTWSDEFNAGTSDLNGWYYQTGNNNGWGNGEYEDYTTSTDNVDVANGSLNLNAVVSGASGDQTYTSGRITTQNLFSQTYGVFEFRAKVPTTSSINGLWPAVWMMPENENAYGSGWPTSGEIDILEDNQNWYSQGSLHTGSSPSAEVNQTGYYAPAGFNANNWNTYDLVWNRPSNGQAGSMQFYVNGNLYETQTGGWYNPTTGGVNGTGSQPNAPFDQPFYFIVNLAVGGSYGGGQPQLADGTYSMQVDYLRAFSAAPAAAATIGSDNTASPAYQNGWQSGQNGGSGFGGWNLVAHQPGSAQAGFFLQDSATISNPGGGINSSAGTSFGLFATQSGSDTAEADAYRSFNAPLVTGEAFSLDLVVNFRNGYKGIDLLDSVSGQTLFNFNIGNDDYVVSDAATGNGEIGNVYSNYTIFHITFTQTSSDGGDWEILRTGSVYNDVFGTYVGVPDSFELYVGGTQGGDPNDLYANNLLLTMVPEPVGLTALAAGSLLLGRRSGRRF